MWTATLLHPRIKALAFLQPNVRDVYHSSLKALHATFVATVVENTTAPASAAMSTQQAIPADTTDHHRIMDNIRRYRSARCDAA